VFATAAGAPDNRNNVHNRLLRRAVELADQRLDERGLAGMPDRITPHSLRRTFVSLLVALGEDVYYVMGQVGHTDPKLTLTVYTKQMERRDGEREKLKALVGAAPSPVASRLKAPLRITR